MMPGAARWTAVVGLGMALGFAGGCKRNLDPAARGYDVATAKGFQRQHDEEMARPDSPLSAVDAFYVDAGAVPGGASLTLRIGAHGGVEQAPSALERVDPGRTVTFALTGDAVTVHEGADEPKAVVPGAAASLDRFRLVGGRQPPQTLRVVVHDPQTPALARFDGSGWFPVSRDYIVSATLHRGPDAGEEITVPTTRGLTKPMKRAGTLRMKVGGEAVELAAFSPSDTAPMLVPFTDATNGDTTYPVGRYLKVDRPAEGDATVVDFNRATNPWCAYSEHYNCPVPPAENRLALRIEAGVMAPPAARDDGGHGAAPTP